VTAVAVRTTLVSRPPSVDPQRVQVEMVPTGAAGRDTVPV
jgi:hypothetical protein